jgi:cold shock CspA family protein
MGEGECPPNLMFRSLHPNTALTTNQGTITLLPSKGILLAVRILRSLHHPAIGRRQAWHHPGSMLPAAVGINRTGPPMATFEKRQKEKKKLEKKQEKMRRKEERKAHSGGGDLESMMAYVDENGMLTDTPPDPAKRVEIDISEIEIGVPRREKEEVDPVHTGKVDFFDTHKGFGFINDDGGRERYFVHVSGLEDEIREGDRVSYELERGPKGLNAVRVKRT